MVLLEGPTSALQNALPAATRILVIEDNPSDVLLLRRALQKQDLRFELIHFLDGGEALAFIRRQGVYHEAIVPDLILVDLNLFRFTGEEISSAIRKAKHLASIPVCMWSSARSRPDPVLLQRLRIDRFITKPSGLDQFMEIGIIIKDLLGVPEPNGPLK